MDGMNKTVRHNTTLDIGGVKIEVEYNYTPFVPASNPDGVGGQMLDPPEEERVEVVSIRVTNNLEIIKMIEDDYEDELIEDAIMDGE